MRARGLGVVAVVLAGLAVPQASNAQLMGLLGSFDGTYCKVKKDNVITARTQLPSSTSEAYVTQMTMRRLASLTRSKGFAAFVITKQKCYTMLINRIPRSNVCEMTAQMEPSSAAPPESTEKDTWFGVETILSLTRADAASYPVTRGLMNNGNKCVID